VISAMPVFVRQVSQATGLVAHADGGSQLSISDCCCGIVHLNATTPASMSSPTDGKPESRP
jgi:hypothetical protein